MTTPAAAQQVDYWELPPLYHRWKWRVLAAFCLFYVTNYLGRFNFSLVQAAVIADLAITRADTGWINSWMFWGFALGDLVHGRLGEKIGFRNLILAGAVGTSVFNVVASFGDTIPSLAVPWALVGFVNASAWGPGLGLVAQWWPRRDRGRAIGLV
ncbi:MAG: MFS transporter, partial [Candidatus Tectomicrobia bacterium]|nr:MFS transporter [Candidatus Tectomicrobia bacterium]